MNIQHPDLIVRHIKTKNKIRKIISYRDGECELRKKHELYQRFLEDNFVPSIFSKGYVKHRSIYHNAIAHLYNDYFIMLDIKDFFPHICHKQLSDKLFYELNKMAPNKISKHESNKLIDMCSVSSRGLPLGFITSPILSNIYLKEFDGILYGNLKRLELDNLIYTRYADDLVISFKAVTGAQSPLEIDERIKEITTKLLSRYGLQINKHKSRFYDMNTSNHVRITGINIIIDTTGRRRVTVGRAIKNKLYWDAIHYLESNKQDVELVQRIKGMQSFVFSIEKCGYEDRFSKNMKEKVNMLGFDSLKSLIDSL